MHHKKFMEFTEQMSKLESLARQGAKMSISNKDGGGIMLRTIETVRSAPMPTGNEVVSKNS